MGFAQLGRYHGRVLRVRSLIVVYLWIKSLTVAHTSLFLNKFVSRHVVLSSGPFLYIFTFILHTPMLSNKIINIKKEIKFFQYTYAAMHEQSIK